MGADLLLTLLVSKDGGDWMEPAVAKLSKPVDAQERSHPRFQVSPVRMTRQSEHDPSTARLWTHGADDRGGAPEGMFIGWS
jgi:hypothetical protein